MTIPRYFLPLVLCLVGCSHSPGEVNGRVTNYGTIVFGQENKVEDPTMTTGQRSQVRDAVFTATTSRIPAKLGLNFGIQYEIRNLPLKDDQEASLTITVTHPPFTNSSQKTSVVEQRIGTRPVNNGRTLGILAYGFDHDYELVPGRWEFGVIYDGKKLCSTEFTVYRE